VHKASESRGLANPTEPQDEGNASAEIQVMQYVRETNTLITINGDQNAFVYNIETRDKEFSELKLARSHCLFLDEIIDLRFMNSNK